MTATIRAGGRADAEVLADVHLASWRARCALVVPAEVLGEAVLYVLDDNPRARTCYDRHGWAPFGIAADDDDHDDLTLPEVEYRKQLASRAP